MKATLFFLATLMTSAACSQTPEQVAQAAKSQQSKGANRMKQIEKILPPPPQHMVGDGFRVHNFFPGGGYIGEKRMSPFYMLDYNANISFPATDTPRGVSVHPHRGFETVTIAYKGRIAHHDSYGNSGVIGEGDVQWMTAGSGVLHKEYHDTAYSRVGGPFHMVQLWVNLPAKHKMTPPKYQPITRDKLGVFKLPDNGGLVEVIAGNYNNVKGPASTFTAVEVYNARLNENANLTLTFPENYNTGILVVEGSITVNGSEHAPADHFVLFKNDGNDITVQANGNTILLILSGEPIDEPLAAYGPFLMNTKEELKQAYDDYSSGKFGKLED